MEKFNIEAEFKPLIDGCDPLLCERLQYALAGKKNYEQATYEIRSELRESLETILELQTKLKVRRRAWVNEKMQTMLGIILGQNDELDGRAIEIKELKKKFHHARAELRRSRRHRKGWGPINSGLTTNYDLLILFHKVCDEGVNPHVRRLLAKYIALKHIRDCMRGRG